MSSGSPGDHKEKEHNFPTVSILFMSFKNKQTKKAGYNETVQIVFIMIKYQIQR